MSIRTVKTVNILGEELVVQASNPYESQQF